MGASWRDRGFNRAIRKFRVAGRIFRVGIMDPEVGKYAAIQEARFGFMRDTFDLTRKDRRFATTKLHERVIAGGDPAEGEKSIADLYAKEVRRRILKLRLIDTRAMLKSVRVLEQKKK